uniref:ARAD1B16852p n=1 Tax=Blastobotrys adeninivorans TaxID=409370 RepID=A0A060T735_BLAAD
MTLFSLSSKSTLSKSGSDSHSHHHRHSSSSSSSSSNNNNNNNNRNFDDFVPTATLQVQAIGYDVDQALTGRTLENISVFRSGSKDPEYVSIRLKKNSNSCALVRASDQATLISTIYRFGPGRHPRMRLLNLDFKVSVEDAIKNEKVQGELIEVKSRSMVSRAQVFDTSLGKFKWRYGTNAEKAACNADSLLVMERLDRASVPGGGCVAQLIRNDQYRTPGSKVYSGGNGGCLFIDLRMWNEDKHTSPQRVEAFVVASCILMLKREADRFIDNHLALVV